jgi:hypothetical protein
VKDKTWQEERIKDLEKERKRKGSPVKMGEMNKREKKKGGIYKMKSLGKREMCVK